MDSATTRNGTKVTLHFETEDAKKATDKAYSDEMFAAELSDRIPEFYDTGRELHLLISSNGVATFMTAADYPAWEKNPVWNHQPAVMYAATAQEALNMIKDLGALLLKSAKFEGPTELQIEKYFNNDIAMKVVSKAVITKDCPRCLVPNYICPKRAASFDEKALEEAIANFKP